MNTDLATARRHVENIRAHLPTSISAVALGVRPTTPYHALVIREALVWRTEELGRCACDMLERDDLAAGILLTRAVLENAVLLWRASELLETRHQYRAEELHEKFQKMLFGEKNSDPTLPEAFNITTLIKRMDKHVPDVQKVYDHLSNFAHPSWSGVYGLFVTHDEQKHTTLFGRCGEGTSIAKDEACDFLAASLAAFEFIYRSILTIVTEYLSELEPLSDTDKIKLKTGGLKSVP